MLFGSALARVVLVARVPRGEAEMVAMIRVLAVILVAAATVFAGCTSESTTAEISAVEVASTSAPVEVSATVGPVFDLVDFTDHLYGIEGLAPPGWSELAYGILLRMADATDATLLVQQAAPGSTVGAVMGGLVAQLELEGPPAPIGTIETDYLTWTRYSVETEAASFGGQLMRGDMALAESDFGAFVVGLVAEPEEYEALSAGMFLPVVQAFVPPPLRTQHLSGSYRDSTLPVDVRVDDLLSQMTLPEKIGQMTQVEKNSILPGDLTLLGVGSLLSGGGGSPVENTPEAWARMVDDFQTDALATRLGIPLIYGVDAVHGHNNVKGATVFPHNVGLGAANDPELMRRIGEITAIEVAATGIDWNFAPTVAVPQDIRWGRTYEGYGEDTNLVASLATAYLEGLQGAELSDPVTVLATPKHFVGDGGTLWGSATTSDGEIDQGDTEADEATLRAVHLPPYIDAINSGARSVMVSYSSWNGTKVHGDRYLVTDVLKDELGFSGFVVSDWGAIDQISDDYYEAVVTSINAGIDMNMVPYDYRRFIWTLWRAVDNGDVAVERIDDAVRRILQVKFELGLFENPLSDPDLLGGVGSEEHRAVARTAVAKSAVLLKNDAGVLPISDDVGVIFVGGQAGDDIGIQSGGWTIEWQGRDGSITSGTSILEGIEAAAPESATVYYDKFGNIDRLDTPDVEPDLCIAVVGERPYAESEGDSADLALASRDLPVLENLAETCGNVVVVLIAGRPLIITDRIEGWDALVAAWLPGTEGQGVADVLFGLEPFTGKLPYTWPSNIEQLPLTEGVLSGDPLFPLGFGLESG